MSATENKQPTAFDQLLGELGEMKKALPAADVTETATTAVAAVAAGEGDPATTTEPLAKGAFQVTLADGSVVEAQDGTELVKALFTRVDNQEDLMVKALGGTIDMVKSLTGMVNSQDKLIKSMQADLARIGGQPAGRKTLLTVHEQVNTMTKSLTQETAAPTPAEIMAKANTAYDDKRISGQELNEISVAVRMRQPIDGGLLAKAMA